MTTEEVTKREFDNRVEYRDGGGRLHRADGPARVYTDGYTEWRWHGAYHREDGPAVIYEGGESSDWYLRGMLHRVGGPAVDRRSRKRWYLCGVRYDVKDYWRALWDMDYAAVGSVWLLCYGGF